MSINIKNMFPEIVKGKKLFHIFTCFLFDSVINDSLCFQLGRGNNKIFYNRVYS